MIAVEAESKGARLVHIEHHAVERGAGAGHGLPDHETALFHVSVEGERRFHRRSRQGQNQAQQQHRKPPHPALFTSSMRFSEASGVA